MKLHIHLHVYAENQKILKLRYWRWVLSIFSCEIRIQYLTTLLLHCWINYKMFWLYTSNCAIMNVLQPYHFRKIGILFPFDKRSRSISIRKKIQGTIFLSLIEITQNQRKRNMTPLTYKRCVYPDICLLLSLVYKHPCLLTHTNENFRKQYE